MRYAPIPLEMYAPCSQPGTIRRFWYESRGKRKNALVYLPYGYDQSSEHYPVLYLMHGGGGDSDEFFGGPEGCTALKALLDNAIATGYVRPMNFPAETADALIASIAERGVRPGDYRVLPCTGDKDIACEALDPMVHELARRQPWFTLGETPEEGSLCYCLKPDGWHTYNDVYEYLWLMLPWLFGI